MLRSEKSNILFPFLTGENIFSSQKNDIESIHVNSISGFILIGGFCKLNKDKISVGCLEKNDTYEDLYGFVLNSDGHKKGKIRILKNNEIATVILLSSVLTVSPFVVKDIKNVSNKLRVINWSNDDKKYPVGAMLIADNDYTENYTSIEIFGTLTEYKFT